MEKFSLNNQIEKVLRGENTSFLNPIDTNYVVNRLRKNNCRYNIFYLYNGCEKLIVYKDKLDISLLEIECSSLLTHKEILGSLFSQTIGEDVFGDIVIDNNKYYIVVLNKIKKYLLLNMDRIGKKKIKLIERDLDTVKDFKNKFKSINIQVTSLRIDSVISKLIPTSRAISSTYISDQKVIVNYQILKNKNYVLKENDIFSIRGIGKFKFISSGETTKSGKIILTIDKYI